MPKTDNTHHYRLCPKCGNFSNILERQSYCILCGTKLIEECTQLHAFTVQSSDLKAGTS